MYQSGREGDAAKKRKSPAKSGRVGITGDMGGEGKNNKRWEGSGTTKWGGLIL